MGFRQLVLLTFIVGFCAASSQLETDNAKIINEARQILEETSKEIYETLAYLDDPEEKPSTSPTTITPENTETTQKISVNTATTPQSSGNTATTPQSSGNTATTPQSSGNTATTPQSSGNTETTPQNPTHNTNTGTPVTETTTKEAQTTVVVTTEQTTVEPTTTALPSTTAEPWELFYLDCNNTTHTCVYTIEGPQLNESVYNAEDKKFQFDKDLYLNASAGTYTIIENFAAHGVVERLNNLTEVVETLENEIAKLTDLVKKMQNDTTSTSVLIQKTNFALNNSVSGVFANTNVGSCYAKSCSRVPLKPTTTTTTPRPTTPSPCLNYNCTGAGYKGSCNVINGAPVCKCPGNLDGKNNCAQASCYNTRIGVYDGTAPGPFWSPNYTSTHNVQYPNNLNCVWKISATSGKKLTVKSNSFSIDASTKISVNDKQIPYTLAADKIQSFLDRYVKGQPYVMITFKSGAVTGTNHFINWDFNEE